MRNRVIATLLLAAGANAAFAADLPRGMPFQAPAQPDYGWTGFYLGVNVGGGWSNTNTNFGTAGFPSFASVDNSLAGAVGGGQAGYNWQQGAAVFGVEADFQFSGMTGGLDAPCPPGICAGLAASFDQKTRWFGTVRGRVGFASNGWLLYGTGGYAYSRLETHAVASAGAVSVNVRTDENRQGWTAGGGIEVAFTRSWTAKVEYLYLDFGSHDAAWTLSGLPTITASAKLRSNLARVGVNYRF